MMKNCFEVSWPVVMWPGRPSATNRACEAEKAIIFNSDITVFRPENHHLSVRLSNIEQAFTMTLDELA